MMTRKREEGLRDRSRLEQDEQERDLGHAFRHEAHPQREGGVEPGGEGPGEGPRGLAQHGHGHDRRDRPRRKLGEGEVDAEAGGGEEERDEEALCCAPQAGHDVEPHPVGHPGERRAEEQRADGAVEADLMGRDDHEEEPAQQQAEGKLGDAQEALQEDDHRREYLRRQHPRDDREADDLAQEDGQLADAGRVVVAGLADGEPHDEQGDQLGNDDGGEDLEAERFLQVSFVGEHLGHDAQARQRKDARQRQRRGERQVEDGERDAERGGEGHDHRDRRGEEEPPPDRGDEAGNIDLVEADEEEEDEDADAQEQRRFLGRLDDARDGAEQHPGGGVGDDRVQAKAGEDPLGNLRDDEEQANGEDRVDHSTPPRQQRRFILEDSANPRSRAPPPRAEPLALASVRRRLELAVSVPCVGASPRIAPADERVPGRRRG